MFRSIAVPGTGANGSSTAGDAVQRREVDLVNGLVVEAAAVAMTNAILAGELWPEPDNPAWARAMLDS